MDPEPERSSQFPAPVTMLHVHVGFRHSMGRASITTTSSTLDGPRLSISKIQLAGEPATKGEGLAVLLA